MIYISILLPVRYHSHQVEACLKSIREKTVNLDDAEVLVAVDQEDDLTPAIVNQYAPFARPVIVDQRNKREGLHEYTNALCREAKGLLLWWLSDDIRIVTYGWDQILKAQAIGCGNDIYKFAPMDTDGGGEAYSMITRKWYDIVGHWSLHPSIDSWVNTIADQLPDNRGHQVIYGLYIQDMKIIGKEKIIIDPKPYHPLPADYQWGSEKVYADIQRDAEKLIAAM